MSNEVLFESVPRGWVVKRAGLFSTGRRADLLPHAAVVVTRNGVRVVCEPGLAEIRDARLVIQNAVLLHLGREQDQSEGTVAACRQDIEDRLARLAARRRVVLDSDKGRWVIGAA